MLPKAHLVHLSHGRIRVRIPSMRKNSSYFKSLHSDFQKVPGARSIVTNAITGSLLIVHSAEIALDTLANFAVKEGLFEIAPELELAAAVSEEIPLSQAVAEICQSLDEGLIKLSEGQVNLKSATFLGLVGLGLYQVSQGRALPAAISLFDDALHVIQK
jgi:hypothetical protein